MVAFSQSLKFLVHEPIQCRGVLFQLLLSQCFQLREKVYDLYVHVMYIHTIYYNYHHHKVQKATFVLDSYKISEVHSFRDIREVVGNIVRTLGYLFTTNFLLLVFVFLVKVMHETRSILLLSFFVNNTCIHS